MGDLKLLQRCIEYRNELGRGLYYALKIGNDGCDDLRTEYESNEFSVPFERMEQMAGDVTPYDIYGFFRELNSIVWSFSCNNRVPDVSLKLLGSLERQQALLEGQRDALDADTSARLEHIVDVALSSALMISHVRQNEELDAPILDSYRELYAKLFADGAIDEDEAMTMDIMDRIINDRLINAPPSRRNRQSAGVHPVRDRTAGNQARTRIRERARTLLCEQGSHAKALQRHPGG